MMQFNSRYFRQLGFVLLGTVCLAVALGFPRIPAIAQINQAVIQEVLGNRVFIEEQQANVSDVAQFREEVRTEQSKAGLRFNNGAVGRLAENSSVTIGQCIEVERGQLLVSGPANGCVSGFAIGVQGTTYTLGMDNDDENVLANLQALEGLVQVGKPGDTETDQPTDLRQGKKVALRTDGTLGPIQDISPKEYGETLSGSLFEGFSSLPQQSRLRNACQALYPNYNCTVAGIPQPRTQPVRGLW